VPLETTLWDEGYSVGVQDSMLRSTQIERVLTDLIAELRETAAVKPGATGRLLMEMVGSAEARLREVGDE